MLNSICFVTFPKTMLVKRINSDQNNSNKSIKSVYDHLKSMNSEV